MPASNPRTPSSRERLFWSLAFTVQVGIWATLPLGGKLIRSLPGWIRLDTLFLVGFLLLMVAVAWGALTRSARPREWWLATALVAVSTLLMSRTGIPAVERSHLIEYGLLAVLIFHALEARRESGAFVRWPAAVAIGLTATLGLLDEAIQAVLPSRVFDPRDLLFNALAAGLTVGLTVAIRLASSTLRSRSTA